MNTNQQVDPDKLFKKAIATLKNEKALTIDNVVVLTERMDCTNQSADRVIAIVTATLASEGQATIDSLLQTMQVWAENEGIRY